jgi:hypothetical protein
VPGNSYCEDCTGKYQKQMVREWRCRFPGTFFEVGQDGEQGIRPADIRKRLVAGEDERNMWFGSDLRRTEREKKEDAQDRQKYQARLQVTVTKREKK